MSEQLPEFDRTFKDELAQEILKSQQRPFTVSIMGQTGVGKTSLLKALFNKAIFNESNESVLRKMRIEHVNFGTTKPETYTIRGENEQVLIINDLPGIGESSSADQNHINTYEQYLSPSDIILWATQSDSRATTVDVEALKHLLSKLDILAQEQLMSKMVFVLTKVDTLVPAPWIMQYNKQYIRFWPGKETSELILLKQDFFQKQLIQPFGDRIVSRTYDDGSFLMHDPFSFEGKKIIYKGLLTKEYVDEQSKIHKENKGVYHRLYANYCPVSCSAHFKYNLPNLMLIILNKLGSDAAQNFKRIVNPDILGTMSLDEARKLSNILVWNVSTEQKIFDLEEGIFPDIKRDSVFYKKMNQHHKGPNMWFNRKSQRKMDE